ncbi:hypothetical protein TNCV_3894751 [Trichonephila clavipes]|nr:hypothetical protein TNCV_3894751 [Trichonephila clavipes]
MTVTLPPLLNTVLGGGTPGRSCVPAYGSKSASPSKGLVLPNFDIEKIAARTRFLVISLPNSKMIIKSPFAINKALIDIGNEHWRS